MNTTTTTAPMNMAMNPVSTTTSSDDITPITNCQTWAPNDDMDNMIAAAAAATVTTTVCDPTFTAPPPILSNSTMEDSVPVTTTTAFNDLFTTTATEDSSMPAVTTSSLLLNGLTTRAEDLNSNTWLIETPSAVSGDPMLKDPFFQTFTTASNNMTPLASTAGSEWIEGADFMA